jgi:hypothetical protein
MTARVQRSDHDDQTKYRNIIEAFEGITRTA